MGPNPFESNGGVIDAYTEKHLRSHATRPERAIEAVKWMLEKYLPSWRSRKTNSIIAEDVRRLHYLIGQGANLRLTTHFGSVDPACEFAAERRYESAPCGGRCNCVSYHNIT